MMADMQEFAWETNNPAYITIARTCKARLTLMQGDLVKARRHLQSADLTADAGTMFFWLETPNLTQCRLFIAQAPQPALHKPIKNSKHSGRQAKSNHNA